MSQIGIISSCSSIVGVGVSGTGVQAWAIQFQYQLDAGGMGVSTVYVGNGLLNPQSGGYGPGGLLPAIPTAALWASPTATITVSPNPPGTSNPVQLPCPPVVKQTMFGL
jgi:hypothetical protein